MLGLRCYRHFLQLWGAGAAQGCSPWPSCWSGFSCCRGQALGCLGLSSCSLGLRSCHPSALERRLNSCGCSVTRGIFLDQAPSACAALAGGFFTTEPPGKPCAILPVGIHGKYFHLLSVPGMHFLTSLPSLSLGYRIMRLHFPICHGC